MSAKLLLEEYFKARAVYMDERYAMAEPPQWSRVDQAAKALEGYLMFEGIYVIYDRDEGVYRAHDVRSGKITPGYMTRKHLYTYIRDYLRPDLFEVMA